ncbi:DUF2357 domain-containing protein [Brevibacillus fluminis]|uniref:DUF2357 domain-containing protein n=1 Tax=Brevibacillus fluminis TaxID=511487 RepID=UPI003F8B6B81
MAIPSSLVPFRLAFEQDHQSAEVPFFFENESGACQQDDHSFVTVVENKRLYVHFQATDVNAKMYMDGLEVLPERSVELDEKGGVFLPPSPEPILLFDYNDFYPLIPGKYMIKVQVDSRLYYTILIVHPKQINTSQWELMRNEVENELRGLAQDFIRKNLGIGSSYMEKLPPRLLMQFILIKRAFPAFMGALSDLYMKVNYRIKKEYRFVPTERAKMVDEETIRNRLRHPQYLESLKVPTRQMNYDLPENRWVKYMTRYIEQIVNEFMLSLENYLAELKEEITSLEQYDFQENTKAVIRVKKQVSSELSRFVELAKKMKTGLSMIKSAPWYDLVSNRKPHSIPHVLSSDHRYRSLFLLYRELRYEKFEVALDSSFSYQWKRTDKLYEIWSFLQIIKVLTRGLNYEAVCGWIFDLDFSSQRLLIPTLPSDTKIVCRNGDITLHLVYDSEMPKQSHLTTIDRHPLYTTALNNRPDGRIDVFREEIYIGSIILEFKYRARRWIWNDASVNAKTRSNTMSQLIAYGNNCRSPFLFGASANPHFHKYVNPVSEVWVSYPTEYETEKPIAFEGDFQIRFVNISPGHSTAHMDKELLNAINNIMDRYTNMNR